MSNPFPTTIRPWLRITQAKRDLSTLILAPGDVAVTETGKMYTGNGVAQLKNLVPIGAATGGGISIVDNGDGTITSLVGVTDNGDGTLTA